MIDSYFKKNAQLSPVKNITLSIPDHKLTFFTELLYSLGFVKQNIPSSEFEIPEEHKKLVLNRIANSTDETMTDWVDVKKELDAK